MHSEYDSTVVAYVCNEDTVYAQENGNADCYENTVRGYVQIYRVRKQLLWQSIQTTFVKLHFGIARSRAYTVSVR